MNEKLKAATRAYANGCTCSQAVLCAYADELCMSEETAFRIMEGFGGGVGGMQEVCGALTAATAIISYYYSRGTPGEDPNREQVFEKVREAADIFQKEYGGVTCRDALRGEKPTAAQCGMKVKDAVLIVEKVIAGVLSLDEGRR